MTRDQITDVAELAEVGRALAAIVRAEGTVSISSTDGPHIRIDFPDAIARDVADVLLDRLLAIG